MSISGYWFTGDVNFGDLLFPELVKAYGYDIHHTADIARSELIAIGSILELVPSEYAGTILGSGFILSESSRQFPNAAVVGVRGHLTQERMSISDDIVLGDPGLLSVDLITRQPKRYKLGIVPHYVDVTHPLIRRMRHTADVLVIDVQRAPTLVLEDIDSCDLILSSSLHGLVCADSFGIPNGWIKLSDNLKGGRFKFDDYYSVIGYTAECNIIAADTPLDVLLTLPRLTPLCGNTIIQQKLRQTVMSVLGAL